MKEVFEFWKEISPTSAYTAGIKECAGTIWIPSHTNIRNALTKIKKLEKSDETTKKFLKAIKRELIIEEPQQPPATLLGTFFSHLIIEGINQKHILELAEQGINFLAVQEHIIEKKWPIEQQIYTAQECQGTIGIIEIIKKKCNQETKEALTALQKRLQDWKEKTTKIQLKKNDYPELIKLLKKSKGPNRKWYREAIKDLYDYLETPEKIEQSAIKWIEQELPEFKKIIKKLSKKYKCKTTIEEVDKAIEKNQKAKNPLETVKKLRKILKKKAEKIIEITPKYDVRIIETPEYLVPFLPTAAMQTFNALTEPFCISFVTTDKKASPSTSIPEIAQTIIHEEYGHCVNFLNSYNAKNKLIEKMGSTLEVPITEGIAFYRELESLKLPFEEFSQDFRDALEYVVMKWRMIRFLRAVSDVRINLGKQNFVEFIEWAHKKTGLTKKLIFDQTFHFQENPGYAPCYSIFGQKLKQLQEKAIKKGYTQKEFNTYIASRGFPARSILEKELKKKFNL